MGPALDQRAGPGCASISYSLRTTHYAPRYATRYSLRATHYALFSAFYFILSTFYSQDELLFVELRGPEVEQAFGAEAYVLFPTMLTSPVFSRPKQDSQQSP